MFDNWIGAVIGSHLRYYGSIEFLLLLKATPSADPFDFSSKSLKEIKECGIRTVNELLKHEIVILDSFYNYEITQSNSTLYEIYDGIFQVNSSYVFRYLSSTLAG